MSIIYNFWVFSNHYVPKGFSIYIFFSDEVEEKNVLSYYYFMSQLSTLNWTTCIDKLDKLLWKYFFELEETQWNVV